MHGSAPLVVLALALGACSGSGPGAEDTGPCTNSINATLPQVDAANAYYRTTIEASFDRAEADAAMTLEGPDGPISGASLWHDERLIFTPDAPLATETSYTAAVAYSCGEPTFSFRTSATGEPIDPSALVGQTYAMSLAAGRFVQPAGAGDLLATYASSMLLVGVASAAGASLDLLGAISEADSSPPVQAPCTATVDFPPAELSENPYFTVGPRDTSFFIRGVEVEIHNLYISGAFAPDGSAIEGGVLSGWIDTRPLVPLVSETGGPETLCELGEVIGVGCEPCADGTGDFCVTLHVDSLRAERVSGLVLERIGDACVERPDVCTCE